MNQCDFAYYREPDKHFSTSLPNRKTSTTAVGISSNMSKTYFRSKFVEISKTIHFCNLQNMGNPKIVVCICTGTICMAAILNVQYIWNSRQQTLIQCFPGQGVQFRPQFSSQDYRKARKQMEMGNIYTCVVSIHH